MKKIGIALLGCLLLIIFIVIPTYIHERADVLRDTKKGAEAGDPHAQYKLGAIYEEGDLVPRDYSKAFEWYLKAADRGDAMAQFNLGDMYEKGRSIPQSDSKAFSWYLMAARQGLASAQGRVGGMYAEGRGTPPDYVEGYAWLSLASEQGDPRGIKAKDTLTDRMTNEYMEYSLKRISELRAEIGRK